MRSFESCQRLVLIRSLGSVSAWKHRFSHECLNVVHDRAFGARPPNYQVIQDLDKEVRDYYVPPSLQVPGFGGTNVGTEVEQVPVELTMQRYTAFAIKEISAYFFFAQDFIPNC